MNKWHHGVFLLVVLGMAAFLLKGMEAENPRLPADQTHSARRDYPQCVSCHGKGMVPNSHLNRDGGIHRGYLRCYVCHRAG